MTQPHGTHRWPSVRLSDACTIIRGVSFDKSEVRTAPQAGFIPILRAGNICGTLDLEHDLIWVPRERVSPEQHLQPGDLAVCMSSGSASVVGKTAQLREPWDGAVGAFCGVIRPRRSETARFLAHWFRSQAFKNWRDGQARGGNIQNLRLSQFESIEVPFPPFPEQQRIAAILDEQMAAVERGRAAAEAQLAAAKALPAAYLREVFPTAEAPLAKGWKWTTVGEVCDVQLGKMLSPKSKGGNEPQPYLRNANVQWNALCLSDVETMDFDERECVKFLLKAGDLLVCEGGEPGRAAIWDGAISPCYYQKALHRIRAKGDLVDPRFLMFRMWAGALRHEFDSNHGKTTIAHLPAIRLEKLPIALPPIREQRGVSERLQACTRAVQTLVEIANSQLDALGSVSAALLRRAFSGEL